MRAGRLTSPLSWRLVAARLALVWEAFWPAMWPAVALSGLFLLVTLGGLWGLMPAGLHLGLLIVLGIALVAALRFALAGMALPSIEAGYRRLERVNGLSHRPLSSGGDKLAGDNWDQASRALWHAHQARQRRLPAALKIGWPRAGLLDRDPYALRVALLLGLVVAAVASAGHRSERLIAAFHVAGAPPAPAVVDAWITPPAFAGAAPIFLSAADPQQNQPIAVPSGSLLTVRVHGADGRPRLVVDDRARAFDPVNRENWALKTTVAMGRDFVVVDESGPLARWRMAPIPELPPKIAFDGTPRVTPIGGLRIAYRASDAYGVTKVTVTFLRPGSSRVVTRDLQFSEIGAKNVKSVGFADLTADPWAGLRVHARLTATDVAGKQGTSAPLIFTLPERQFRNPVARAIIALRRMLARDPSKRFVVADGLAAIAAEPEAYQNDATVFLSLKVAQSELENDGSAAAMADVLALLWSTALGVEDGNVSLDREALRQAEKRLMAAMTNKAPAADIERRLQALQGALDRFLAAMRQRAAALGDVNRPVALPPNAQAVTPEVLQDLMRHIRALTETGAQDAARQMLARLEGLMEQLQAGFAPPRPAPPEIGQLSNLMARERQILDRSFRAFSKQPPSNNRQAASPSRDTLRSLAQEQEAIEKALEALERRLRQHGLPPLSPLQGANDSMSAATTSLKGGERGPALTNEGQALMSLGQALQALQRAVMAKGGPGKSEPGVTDATPTAADPLGRPMPSFWQNGSWVKIPSHGRLQRSHVILEELYRRLDDPTLPPVERQYIERLLHFF